MNRREFVKSISLGAAGTLSAGCGISTFAGEQAGERQAECGFHSGG
jgi:hypothetical protein